MSDNERKIDHLLAVIVLCLLTVLIAIKWIMAYQDVNEGVMKAVSIITTVVLCLMFCIVLYNACCFTDNIIFRIIFIILTLFLIASAIAVHFSSVQTFFQEHNIPLHII